MAKEIRVTFRQARVNQEIAEKQVNEAFDILFAEVQKRLHGRKSNYLSINSSSVEGGDRIWAS
ncbi:hypothetical protein A3D00_03375 [Candidatus Woesebacteria bacterium RIFCSPHIGHO2_02_FULL_38_9]|uniref:Uncharacterized protein n=1 Tax=Candidatus Woesebacteria bacterium RIFCSPHIGHO2_01_FULL_39_28 TaxID=1802496 RepID=A0A1F7YEH7_9BACT|nr:MAG: hypothetical protein A2627_01580 [Candidatus Woesebacteria bacterium RIFCSPHIGHO2_01_FULL_39_28]OGM32276.1 MAG: hypothetical protein A3D00_03375 [Candidatus Woesebacteria bacterium RIFCSPHIGHO2_02_FULL_38_9]OGM56877.1 MAG: hypothetical protein A3A50_03965 [Candidatus Woesebacteria bacterium RIFCSPLOWO2_01_FULL_38_20]